MNIDTIYLNRCVKTLDCELDSLQAISPEDEMMYDLCRAGIVKEYEIILEQAGKLLRKRLLPYFHSKKAVDELVFKDVFRHAGHHGILNVEEVERWLHYRDNRNSTSHDYGVNFAEQTLALLPQFIIDAHALITAIEKGNVTEAAT